MSRRTAPLLLVLLALAVALPAAWPRASSGVSAQTGCGSDAAAAPDVVVTDHGAVRGTRDGQVAAFKGIPYAAPPTGGLRWRPPVEPDCWTGVRPAGAFGAVCPQLTSEGVVTGDEDCLTLNLWTPALPEAATSPLPVMVFIHGDGNAQGAASQDIYDGARLAQAGVVLVTFNYRLGPLGFLSHPTLTAESATASSGNYGLMDQIAALRWVQRNVAAFGGDPGRVTILGESAGAVDLCAVMASPLAAGLFHRAIMESGACLGPGLQGADRIGPRFLAASPCAGVDDVPACLRGLDPATVLRILPATVSVASAGQNTYGPVVDGYVLPASPGEMVAAGRHNRVPLIIGANADETGMAVGRIDSAEAYRAAVVAMVGPALGERVLAQYRVAAFSSPRAALVAATTDARFVCTARRDARAVAGSQDEPVYRYFFTQTARGAAAALGSFHGLELAYVFGTGGAISRVAPTEQERALSDALIGYWTRFAATGDPNGAGAPQWPRYDPARDPHLVLGPSISAGDGVRTANCDFWDDLIERLR